MNVVLDKLDQSLIREGRHARTESADSRQHQLTEFTGLSGVVDDLRLRADGPQSAHYAINISSSLVEHGDLSCHDAISTVVSKFPDGSSGRPKL